MHISVHQWYSKTWLAKHSIAKHGIAKHGNVLVYDAICSKYYVKVYIVFLATLKFEKKWNLKNNIS